MTQLDILGHFIRPQVFIIWQYIKVLAIGCQFLSITGYFLTTEMVIYFCDMYFMHLQAENDLGEITFLRKCHESYEWWP